MRTQTHTYPHISYTHTHTLARRPRTHRHRHGHKNHVLFRPSRPAQHEYDRDKDHVGQASEYSIRYKGVVLDATDAAGRPYAPPLLCPFHMLNDHTAWHNVALHEGTSARLPTPWEPSSQLGPILWPS